MFKKEQGEVMSKIYIYQVSPQNAPFQVMRMTEPLITKNDEQPELDGLIINSITLVNVLDAPVEDVVGEVVNAPEEAAQ